MLLFKSKLPQAAISAMLVHKTDRSDSTLCNTDPHKKSKTGTYYEAFCKTRIDLENKNNSKNKPQIGTGIGIAKDNSQQHVRGTSVHGSNFNQRGFQRR